MGAWAFRHLQRCRQRTAHTNATYQATCMEASALTCALIVRSAVIHGLRPMKEEYEERSRCFVNFHVYAVMAPLPSLNHRFLPPVSNHVFNKHSPSSSDLSFLAPPGSCPRLRLPRQDHHPRRQPACHFPSHSHWPSAQDLPRLAFASGLAWW